MSRTCSTLVLLVASAGHAAAAYAQPSGQASTASEAEPEVASRFSLGARGFAGGVFSDEERRAGGGGGILLAFGIVPERWELEAGLSLVAAQDRDPLGVFEIVTKYVFERRGAWAPHLLVGPAFSLDFGSETEPSGGFVLGAGITHWFTARLGLVGDTSYRLLIGSKTDQVLTLALGLTVRL